MNQIRRGSGGFAGKMRGFMQFPDLSELYGLNSTEMEETIRELAVQREALNEKLLWAESALYYHKLLKEGADREQISEYLSQDAEMLTRSEAFLKRFNALRDTFFGYPGNLTLDTPLVRRLRKMEAELYYVNNCGDPYEAGNSPMDGKEFEREILALFYRKFEIDPEKGWGYVTSGGTESNLWGIRNGFKAFPNGRLYFCEAAHYSVEKAAQNGAMKVFPYTVIRPSGPRSEKIDITELLDTVRKNYRDHGEPPVLLLTWGTTKLGSIDPVSEIALQLDAEGIPHYIHVDAAFYGGIPNNQAEAPVVPSLQTLGANSISVSFHKFFGVPMINSVVLARDKAIGKEVDYIGQNDTTISGSRTFPVFSAFQRIKEVLERSPGDYYIRNIRYFEDAIKRDKIPYFRDGLSNIFVFEALPEWILRKYQLAAFAEYGTCRSLAHIIVNPFHIREELDQMLNDLKCTTALPGKAE